MSQKVVLLGEGCVGKTSIVARYVKNTFDEAHHSTLQAAYFEKKVNVDGKRLTLALWDTAGQERFHALGPIYYRDSKGAILVYDITDVDSFERVKNWVKELRRMLGQEVVLIIVGNKIDLDKDRRVVEQDSVRYAETVGALHLQTSAKTNRGIEELFLTISRALLRQLESQQAAATHATGAHGPPSTAAPRSNVVVVDDRADGGHSSSCCG